MAAAHKTQATIAAALGLPKKKFETVLERKKGDNPERLAWERGRARFEQHITDTMVAASLGTEVEEKQVDDEGNPILDEHGQPVVKLVRVLSKIATTALIYLTKAQLGWSEKDKAPSFQDNRIQITLPLPMEEGDLLKALGQKEILDFRKPVKNITPPIAPNLETK